MLSEDDFVGCSELGISWHYEINGAILDTGLYSGSPTVGNPLI